jgi:hypothetical protein
MQVKLKYKLFGEFSNYEVNELVDWFTDNIGKTPLDAKSLKVTLDWEPGKDADV